MSLVDVLFNRMSATKSQSAKLEVFSSTSSPTGRTMHAGEREIERRHTSSTIIHEEYLGAFPSEGEVRYVEVPVYEEVIKRVPKKEIVEIEKFVPKYQYEYVDRVVEIPQIHYVDRQVEIPQIQEVIRHVTRKEVVDVPKEVIRHIPKVETVLVEKVVEVPGQIFEVPKPYIVENRIPTPRFVDHEVPMVVAQTIKPIMTESDETVEIDVFEYEPQVVVVDVHVPKPVSSQLIAAGMIEEVHSLVTVPAAQYNSMLKLLNSHIAESDQITSLPFIRESNGAVPVLHGHEANLMYPAPISSAHIQGWTPGSASCVQQFISTAQNSANTFSIGGHRIANSGVAPSRYLSNKLATTQPQEHQRQSSYFQHSSQLTRVN